MILAIVQTLELMLCSDAVIESDLRRTQMNAPQVKAMSGTENPTIVANTAFNSRNHLGGGEISGITWRGAMSTLQLAPEIVMDVAGAHSLTRLVR